MSEIDQEYKDKVLKSKSIVEQMIVKGREKNIDPVEIESDIDSYLKSQGLTSFDLRTNGERKDSAYVEAFLHGFNTKFKDILKVVVPEITPTALTLSPFDPEFLEKNKAKKQEISNMIESLFTEELPGVGKIIDQGFTPENLGERMADQAGESLIEFLPLMIAPELIATQGPVQGFKTAITQDPTKLQKVIDVINNSAKSVINTYIKNPGKSFIADISGSIGYGVGEELGTEIVGSAEEDKSVGYYDMKPVVETGMGLGGAGTAVVGSQILLSPFRTKQAITNVFKSYFGLKPLLGKFTSGIKKSRENKVAAFFRDVLKKHEDDIVQAQDIDEVTGGTLKLSTAEETMSPGLAAEQESIERKLAGAELDNVVQRRINNLNALDETLSKIVPETDKDFQYFLDLREGTIQPLIKKLEQQIATGEETFITATGEIKPTLSKKESGQNLRTIIEDAQFKESQEVVNSLNSIPGGQQLADVEILDNLMSLLAREFETGAEPAILSKIKQKIQKFQETETQFKVKDPETKEITYETSIIPPEKELTNQDLFDIWLSASLEETALLGKAGIDKQNKLQRLSQVKSKIFETLQTNLKDTEGAPNFFKTLDDYINKFENGVIVRLKDKKPAGYQIKDEMVADAYFQTENVEAMKDFLRVFGKDSKAISNMQDAILDRLANESINMKTGLLDVDQYRRFLTKYASSLKELEGTMPDFVKKIQEMPTALSSVADRLAVLNKRKSFLEGEKLKNTLNIFGNETKQLNLGTVDEYVNAALADPTLMSNLAQRIKKADAGDIWVKSVLENLTKLRPNAETGAISAKEIANMKNWIKTNNKSLEKLFSEMGPEYKNHLKNLNAIVSGFERVNFVIPPRGSPAPTPSDQMKQALGTDIPQVWSRMFAVASNRTGWKFVGAEMFNRFLNTIGVGHFDKVMKEAIYNPKFAKTLAKINNSKEATVGDMKNLYGFLAKMNGTIGTVSQYGDVDATPQDETRSNVNIMAPTPDISFKKPDIIPESRLADVAIANPVGMFGAPVTGGMDPNTMARGQALFGGPNEITFASKGGIMSTNKAFQRVA